VLDVSGHAEEGWRLAFATRQAQATPGPAPAG